MNENITFTILFYLTFPDVLILVKGSHFILMILKF
jgi:hypothetical protein